MIADIGVQKHNMTLQNRTCDDKDIIIDHSLFDSLSVSHLSLLSLCLLFLGVLVGSLAASGCDLVLVLLCCGALPSVVCASGVWEGGVSGCVVFACVSCCLSFVLAGIIY